METARVRGAADRSGRSGGASPAAPAPGHPLAALQLAAGNRAAVTAVQRRGDGSALPALEAAPFTFERSGSTAALRPASPATA